MSITSFLVRSSFGSNDRKRDAGLSTPETIERFDDIQYGPEKKWQILDVYRPRSFEGLLPVIVNVHGGGFVYGTKEVYQFYCMELAGHGFAVVNFTYRLAPEFKFPSALEDTAAVFGWVLENAEKYGFDTKNIFAVGDSAGATLLSLYCCIHTNPDYARNYSFKTPCCPKAVLLNCGQYHQPYRKKKDLTSLLMANLMPHHGTEEEYRLLNVDEHTSPDFPPAYIMTGEGDFLAGQAPLLYENLKNLGVEVQYHYYGNKDHVLGHVFHCNIRLPEAAQCNSDECAFLRRKITH